MKDIERTATVITMTDCQLLAIPAADFRNLMSRHPKINEKITRQAERRLQNFGDSFTEAHH